MDIKPFKVEEWMNAYETYAKYNIAETCVESISVNDLFALCGKDKEEFISSLCNRKLTYGDIEGLPKLKKGISTLYKSINCDEIVTMHGAAGANHHVFYSLINPGDRVISIMPTYQQLYSIPEAYKADLKIVKLKKENDYLPNINEIDKLAIEGTKLICINNPNNPTGALMDTEYLKQIIGIARRCGAYILCDEVYRHLTQEDIWSESIVDLYEKGISIGSMSKVFSLAGLRLGWIATHDKELIKSLLSHRDYNTISCSIFDETIAAFALENKDKVIGRSKSIVRNNLKILDEFIGNEPHLSYSKPKAGTTALVYYDFNINSYEFCKGLFETTGAFVTPGDCFEMPSSFRIGYANSEQVLKDGLKALKVYIKICEAKNA